MKQKTIAQKQAENMAFFLEHGPRLRIGANTWIIAKSADGRFVKIGGLGSCGIGEMWDRADDDHLADPEWAEAPIMECDYPAYKDRC